MGKHQRLHAQNGKKDLESTSHLPPLGNQAASDRERARQRRRRWFGLAVVTVALGGAVWYFHPYAGVYVAEFEQLPGLGDSLGSLAQRLETAERKVQGWTQNNQNLREQLEELEQQMSSNIEVVRDHARSFADDLERRLDRRLTGHKQWMEDRLAKIEARQNSDTVHMAQLQSDLLRLQDEIGVLDQDIAQIGKISQEMAALERQLDRSKDEWEGLARKLDRNRLDFEVSRNVSVEVAPDIVMQLTRTNLRKVRFDAWIRLVTEGRTLWVRDHGIQQPVIFYGKRGNTPRELVVTHLTGHGAVGYLLLPTTESESTMYHLSQRRNSPGNSNWASSP